MGFVSTRPIPDNKDVALMQALIDGNSIKQAESIVGLSSSSVIRRLDIMKQKYEAGNLYQLIAILTHRKFIEPKP